VHPASWEYGPTRGSTDQRYDVSLMCDDLSRTMTELEGRGARFVGETEREPWGTTARLDVPGFGPMTLFQPTYDPPALRGDQ
jgi:hypothetical protein